MRGYRKAIVGGVVACLSFLAPVVNDGVSPSELVGALLALVTGFQVTYWTRNTVTKPLPETAGSEPLT